MTILSADYFQQSDTLALARDLIGKQLMTAVGGVVTGGMIVETEAYCAPDDRASHAYDNRRTKRNAAMFMAGGVAYVYLCYGIHSLFNIVTNIAEIPHAILIRAIEPKEGIGEMCRRRGKEKLDATVAGGPGALSQALAIDLSHNGAPLVGPVWVEEHKHSIAIAAGDIVTSPRVGVDYAGEDAHNPWRYRLRGSKWSTRK